MAKDVGHEAEGRSETVTGIIDATRANMLGATILPGWDPARLSSRAIGAADLIAHLRGELTLEQARAATLLATRQYAKRQSTWFRGQLDDRWKILFTKQAMR